MGLKAFYNGDVEFNELVHKVCALSYVPVEDVVKVYEDQIVSVIEEKIENNETWNEGPEIFLKNMLSTWTVLGLVRLA